MILEKLFIKVRIQMVLLKKQWGIVGDTFILGCKIPEEIVYLKFNKLANTISTQLGIYSENCGLQNKCSFGHDEYLYRC